MSRVNFQENLQRLAAGLGCYDANALAKRLGWIRSRKKWLRRAWSDGIERPNSRTKDDLHELACHLGVKPSDLWMPPTILETENEPGESLTEFKRQHEMALFQLLSVEVVYWYLSDLNPKVAEEFRSKDGDAGMRVIEVVKSKAKELAQEYFDRKTDSPKTHLKAWSSDTLDLTES